jgi:AcrR family transcriptional regulator
MTEYTTRRAGRRSGAAGTARTRAAILGAAREAFAAKGFAGATIRQIASAAAVDPALVLHYFKAKDELFLAVLRGGVDPQRLLTDLFAADAEALGQQVVGRFLALWEDGAGLTATALLRAAVEGERNAEMAFHAARITSPVIAQQLARWVSYGDGTAEWSPRTNGQL